AGIALRAHRGAVHVVEPVQPEGQCLPAVADHDFQLWEAIEHSTGDDGQQVHAGVDAESVDRAVQAASQQRLDQPFRGSVGVQVNRYVQCLGGGKNIPELRIIQ